MLLYKLPRECFLEDGLAEAGRKLNFVVVTAADEITRGNLKPDSRSVPISELKVARSIFPAILICRPMLRRFS